MDRKINAMVQATAAKAAQQAEAGKEEGRDQKAPVIPSIPSATDLVRILGASFQNRVQELGRKGLDADGVVKLVLGQHKEFQDRLFKQQEQFQNQQFIIMQNLNEMVGNADYQNLTKNVFSPLNNLSSLTRPFPGSQPPMMFPTNKRQKTVVDHEKIAAPKGIDMPPLGFGTFGGNDSAEKMAGAIGEALRAGYRHFDCAELYSNEAELGAVFKSVLESKALARSELFITSKVWNTNHAPEHVLEACQRSINNLQCGYLDLYLIHWPVATKYSPNLSSPFPRDRRGALEYAPVSLQQTWQAMEMLVDRGLVRHIGLSNCTAIQIQDLLSYARIKPYCLQVEAHPYLPQSGLLSFCRHRGIKFVAYSPIGRPGLIRSTPILANDTVMRIGEEKGMTPAQVVLKWGLQRGTSLIPKSCTPSRIKSNFETLQLPNLSPEHMQVLDSLGRTQLRYCNMDLVIGSFSARGSTLYE